MKLLFFWVKITVKRLVDLFFASPVLFIAAAALIGLLAALNRSGLIHIGITCGAEQFAAVLGIAAGIGVIFAWAKAGTLEAELFRRANSRFSNRALLRRMITVRSLFSTVPLIALMLLYALGFIRLEAVDVESVQAAMAELSAVLKIPPTSAELPATAKLLLVLVRLSRSLYRVFGLALIATFSAAFLLQYLGCAARKTRKSQAVRFAFPRFKSLIADYGLSEIIILWLALFFGSLFLVYDFLSTLAAEGGALPDQAIKNYCLVVFLLGSVPFLDIIGAVQIINWNIRVLFNFSYAGYFRRSALFLSALSLPLWLPFLLLCLVHAPAAALPMPFFLAAFLVFTVNLALSMMNPFFKSALSAVFLVFAAYAYYTQPLLGFALLIPAGFAAFRGRGNFADWGSYDYLLKTH